MKHWYESLSAYQKGVTWIILSAFGFSLMNLMVRLAGDLPAMQKSFFRNSVAFLFAYLAVRRQRTKQKVERKFIPWLLLRSFIGTVAIVGNYYSLSQLNIADASLLNKLSPFFVLIFSRYFLGERLKFFQIASLGMAFVGLLLISQPGTSAVPFWPFFAGLMGGVLAGGAYTIVRYLTQNGVSGAMVVLYFSGLSSVFLFPFMIFQYQPMSWLQLFYLLMAASAACLAQFGITYAYHYAPAKEISIFDYSSVIFTALWGILFLGDFPVWTSLLAYGIIFGASYLSYRGNLRENANQQDSESDGRTALSGAKD